MDSEKLEGEELETLERKVLIQGACNNILPKLVADDLDIFSSILEDVFPGSEVTKMEDEKLKETLDEICKHRWLGPKDSSTENGHRNETWYHDRWAKWSW